MNGGTVGIVGAGTMGAGIAQVAAISGWTVELMDMDEATVRAAIDAIGKRLDRLVEKGRLDGPQRDDAVTRLRVASGAESLGDVNLVIEAVVENFDTKVRVLGSIVGSVSGDAIIASNTSALSISRLGEAIGSAPRTVGMHFFNPAPLMKLVEVIAGVQSEPSVVDRAAAIAGSWGKVVARAADVPGFIVNHVARPYYLEAFRILEDGIAGPDAIDDAMRDVGGFRMGPLELTDLIGQDVNTATTRSVWAALGEPPLLAPSRLQEALVAEGHLGRKSGRGVYAYDGEEKTPAVEVEPRPLEASEPLREAVDAFAVGSGAGPGSDLQRYIFARIVAALIVQAILAEQRGVAARIDIDTALKYGTNYPRGPFEWLEETGSEGCRRLMETLNATVDDDRFSVPPGL